MTGLWWLLLIPVFVVGVYAGCIGTALYAIYGYNKGYEDGWNASSRSAPIKEHHQ